MHHQPGRRVGNQIYYGNYRGGACSPQNRNKCLLIFLCVLLVLSGFIVTIVGFTLEPFWSESDASWCSFCKEDRETTLRNTANCRIAGPILLGLGVIAIIVTVCYSKKIQNDSSTQGTTLSTSAPTNIASYTTGPSFTTTQQTVHPPPQQNPPSPYPSTQYPHPQPYPPSSQYPQPAPQPYPNSQYPPSQPYQPGPYPPQAGYQEPSAPNMPPPPTYNDSMGYNEKQ